MLVHPDKNMGNEKAVEAFKKLQNAYEVMSLVSTGLSYGGIFILCFRDFSLILCSTLFL